MAYKGRNNRMSWEFSVKYVFMRINQLNLTISWVCFVDVDLNFVTSYNKQKILRCGYSTVLCYNGLVHRPSKNSNQQHQPSNSRAQTFSDRTRRPAVSHSTSFWIPRLVINSSRNLHFYGSPVTNAVTSSQFLQPFHHFQHKNRKTQKRNTQCKLRKLHAFCFRMA